MALHLLSAALCFGLVAGIPYVQHSSIYNLGAGEGSIQQYPAQSQDGYYHPDAFDFQAFADLLVDFIEHSSTDDPHNHPEYEYAQYAEADVGYQQSDQGDQESEEDEDKLPVTMSTDLMLLEYLLSKYGAAETTAQAHVDETSEEKTEVKQKMTTLDELVLLLDELKREGYGAAEQEPAGYVSRQDDEDVDADEEEDAETKTYESAKSGQRKLPSYLPTTMKKIKQKVITVNRGAYIPGGTQIPGNYQGINDCMKVCNSIPSCFGGDYDVWTSRCFIHGNATICKSTSPHDKINHFKKVPCDNSDMGTENARVFIGTQLGGGIKIPGVKSVRSCIKTCLTAGGGVANSPTEIHLSPQLCFGVDYDFADHTCYLHTMLSATATGAGGEMFGVPGGINCFNDPVIPPVNLVPKASAITVVICPPTP